MNKKHSLKGVDCVRVAVGPGYTCRVRPNFEKRSGPNSKLTSKRHRFSFSSSYQFCVR